MTSKELVYATLSGTLGDHRTPRQLWTLPWADLHYPKELAEIKRRYPDDILTSPSFFTEATYGKGDPYAVGESMDDWGGFFENRQAGIVGEVKKSAVADEDWSDTSGAHIPTEWLSTDWNAVERFRAEHPDHFLFCGCCPRPFEQMQFLRGTENLMMDLADPPPKMLAFLKKMHDFYCQLLEKWAKTGVDALNMMDDWGSQNSLLINPKTWVEIFKPLYRDYIDIAHSHGKKIFMHSDGNTLAILPHLIELGLDAFNTQIFCIGVEKLAPYAGQITFWGEIDRQNLLPYATEDEIFQAVKLVRQTLRQDGGVIAQCEFGIGAKPENVMRVFSAWEELEA
jgi:uroporphyrinogen decarboxylase